MRTLRYIALVCASLVFCTPVHASRVVWVPDQPGAIPFGFQDFCVRRPSDSNCTNEVHVAGPALRVSRQLVMRLQYVNEFVNAHIKYVDDNTQYGTQEYWEYPVKAGDCEDYALLKQQMLLALGLPQDALLLSYVHDKKSKNKEEDHVVLTIVTDRGDLVLDNQLSDVWDAESLTDYYFLSRQSRKNPSTWDTFTLVKDRVSAK